MSINARAIRTKALALAEVLDIKDGVLIADAETAAHEAAYAAEHNKKHHTTKKAYELRKGCELFYIANNSEWILPRDQKSGERLAFEEAVLRTLNWRATIERDHRRPDGSYFTAGVESVVYSNNPSIEKNYHDMTPEERRGSGTVYVPDILADLMAPCPMEPPPKVTDPATDLDNAEKAISASLVAARALDAAAACLRRARAAYDLASA